VQEEHGARDDSYAEREAEEAAEASELYTDTTIISSIRGVR
jgi:hypothetical protein